MNEKAGSNDPPDKVTQLAAESLRWLPNFCSGPVIFSAMVIAQLVAIVLALAPFDDWSSAWHRLTLVSLFVQWVAVTSVALLCLSKRLLSGMPIRYLVVAQYALVLLVVTLFSELTFQADRELAFGLIGTTTGHARFVLSNLLIAACVVAAAVRYFYLNAQRERIRIARSEARVQALQARIRPHFLFNSMNTIAGLIRQDPASAERAVEDLSDLFRGALAAGREQVTLADEFELVRRYIAIETLRLGDRLTVEWQLNDIPLDIKLPPLTLQPLMENAIYHGIQLLPDGGAVRVVGMQLDDTVSITIQNPLPGPGARKGAGAGIALDNISQRLSHWGGPKASLKMHPGDEVFVVELTLPKHN